MKRILFSIAAALLFAGCQSAPGGAQTADSASSAVSESSQSSLFSSSSISWKTYTNDDAGFSFSYPQNAYFPSLMFDRDLVPTDIIVVEDHENDQVFLTPVELGFADKNSQSMAIKPATLEILRTYASDTGLWQIHFITINDDTDLEKFLLDTFPFEKELGARWKKVQLQPGTWNLSMEYDCYDVGKTELSPCPMNPDYTFLYRPEKKQLIWWRWNYKLGDPKFLKTAEYDKPGNSFDTEIVESLRLL